MSRRGRHTIGFAVSLAVLAMLVGGVPAPAFGKSVTAVIVRATGHVEVLRSGESKWAAAAVGARLGERDEIRAMAASSAVLELPDKSTLVLAENSRLAISKLDYDDQGKNRDSMFHLAVGKVRALVTSAALTLVRARQANFVITTPTAVAAARGTDYVVFHDPSKDRTTVTVLEEGKHPVSSRP